MESSLLSPTWTPWHPGTNTWAPCSSLGPVGRAPSHTQPARPYTGGICSGGEQTKCSTSVFCLNGRHLYFLKCWASVCFKMFGISIFFNVGYLYFFKCWAFVYF